MYKKVCSVCGNNFNSKAHNATLCSDVCKKKYRVIYNREQNKLKKIDRYCNCPVCDKKVLLKSKVSVSFCSELCRIEGGKIRTRKYINKNKDKYLHNQKKYRHSEKRKQWLKDNKESLDIKNKEWRFENKENILKNQRDRYKNNIEQRLRVSVRGYLQRMITRKSKSTTEYISYSLKDLKLYLESLFKDGMSWDNYGDWHIDHIRPLCSFSFFNKEGLEDMEEIKKAMDLSNLQPLWAEENLKKSGFYIPEDKQGA